MFSNREEAKKAGWFSRRHQEPQAHLATQKKYRDKQGDKEARIRLAQEDRDKRTSYQQILILDKRLGKGKGAKKERERLRLRPDYQPKSHERD